MDIGLVYSDKDPRQRKARDFVREFLSKRGMLATLRESQSDDVKSPTLIVNGRALKDLRERPRDIDAPMFPTIKDMAEALERYLWSL
jgi:hypothetical protein